MSLPGMLPPGVLGGGVNPGISPEEMQQMQQMKYIQWAMGESCAGKTVIAGVMGAGLGSLFGLFTSSMRYDTPLSSPLNPGATLTDLPWRQQLKHGLKDMGRTMYSSGRNFGLIGALFSGTECCIEGFRGTNDLYNGIAAGCMTGGILARNAGPQAMLLGAAGFGAFSAAIDMYMRGPEREERRPVI